MRLELPYGVRSYPIDMPIGRAVTVLDVPPLPAPPPLRVLLDDALAPPRGTPLPALPANARITLIISDATRAEPRAAFIEAIRTRLPASARLTVAVATGTHGPATLSDLEIPPALLAGATIVNHDGHSDRDLVTLGTTPRETPVCVHRCVVDADLVVATGCIRPHYFAGFGAGAKAIFPGLGQATAIRVNHRLKLEREARAGILDGNPCREDIEAAVQLVATRTPLFLINGVCDVEDRIRDVVAGDVVAAFRRGCELARPWFSVRAAPAPLVIASDALPVTASLYQAAKIAAAAAPLVEPNGTLVLVAECGDGIGPLETVNEAIFRIGVLPRLAPGVRLVLVSGLSELETQRTLLTYARSVDEVLSPTPGRVIVVPHASKLLVDALPSPQAHHQQ